MISIPDDYTLQVLNRHVSGVKYNKYSNVYNGSCPFCKEGDSYGRSKRFYFVVKKQLLYCHNCGYSKKPLSFILDVTGRPIADVLAEVKANSIEPVDLLADKKETAVPPQPAVQPKVHSLPQDCINLSDTTQLEFFNESATIKEALSTIKKRRLLEGVNSPKTFYVSLIDKVHKNRLVIPFVDNGNKIIYYQTRLLLEKDKFTHPKYLSKTGDEKSLYGINNVDPNLEYLFINEGPINAFFIKNGVAVCGIQEKSINSFTARQQEQLRMFPLHKHIWMLDNQWVDKTSLSKTKILLEAGETVFIWPEDLKRYKDVNDYIIGENVIEFDQK